MLGFVAQLFHALPRGICMLLFMLIMWVYIVQQEFICVHTKQLVHPVSKCIRGLNICREGTDHHKEVLMKQ